MSTSGNDYRGLRWAKENPQKRFAHRAVTAAIASGELEEPDPPVCESCGEITRLVAYHFDYALPLDVNWICHHCHYWLVQGTSPAPARKKPAPPPRARAKPRISERPAGRPRKEVSPQHREEEVCFEQTTIAPRYHMCEAMAQWQDMVYPCKLASEAGEVFCKKHRDWQGAVK